MGEGIGNTVSLLYKHPCHGRLNIFASMGENFEFEFETGIWVTQGIDTMHSDMEDLVL